MDKTILQLLAGDNPKRAQEFVLTLEEQRTASWADAHRQASLKAASKGHVSHFRGQLRHQLGETALLEASQIAGLGCLPFRTVKPGGIFMVARIGRFGLVSLSVPKKRAMPRFSWTRRLLSEPNEDLDPQEKLRLVEKSPSRGATELAYFGCIVALPWRKDPSVPAEIALAVPNARLTDWLAWIPLTGLHAALQDLVDDIGVGDTWAAKPIVDRRLPTFRLPKEEDGAKSSG